MTYYDNKGQINDEALNVAGGKTFQVVQLADAGGNVISPAVSALFLILSGIGIPSYTSIELSYTSGRITTVVYKSSSTTVATITVGYNSTGDISTITKS